MRVEKQFWPSLALPCLKRAEAAEKNLKLKRNFWKGNPLIMLVFLFYASPDQVKLELSALFLQK